MGKQRETKSRSMSKIVKMQLEVKVFVAGIYSLREILQYQTNVATSYHLAVFVWLQRR